MNQFRIPITGAILWLLHAGAPLLQAQIIAPPTAPVVTPTARIDQRPNPDPQGPSEWKPRDFNSAPMVRVDVLMISGQEDRMLPILRQLRDPAQIVAAEQRLLDMVARKEATLEGWPELTTYSQMRAVSEAIVERRYPTEFDVPTGAPTSTPEQAAAMAKNATGSAPSTFETRNTGATLEVEPVVSSDGKAVSLNLSPQIVRLESFVDFPAGITAKGEKLSVSQPIFTTSKVSTSLTLKDGERRLIHVGKAGGDRSQLEVFILGATIIPPAVERK